MALVLLEIPRIEIPLRGRRPARRILHPVRLVDGSLDFNLVLEY